MKGQGDKCDSRRCRRRKPVSGRVTPGQATRHQEAYGPLGSQGPLLRSQRMSKWIPGTVKTRNVGHMKTLLKSLVRSQVEYCCILWSPREQSEINLIESVQKDFTARISKYIEYDEVLQFLRCNTSYEERLADLKL